MQSRHYNEDHLAFADAVRTFIAKEMQPDYLAWEAAGMVPREAFREAGAKGFLAFRSPSSTAAAEPTDFRFNPVLGEDSRAGGRRRVGVTLHNDICLPYFLHYAPTSRSSAGCPASHPVS